MQKVASLRDMVYKISSLLDRSPNKENELCSKLGFSSSDLQRLKYGRLSLTPAQIKSAANIFSVEVSDLINYKNSYSYKGMVHCMSAFSSQEHCDEILDLIDAYIDLKEAAL